MRQTVIIGTGCLIPEIRVPNEDFLNNRFFGGYNEPFEQGSNPKIVDTFRKITDISERRYARDDQVASDIALIAAQRALEDSGIDGEELDYVIFAHNFGDVRHNNRHIDLVPTLAARVKQGLGVNNPECIAYDLPFGCPGWLQGVIQADYFLKSGDATRALVIGAETLSRISDPHDRDSMIYSDGAGAVVLEARPSPDKIGVLTHAVRSDTLDHAHLLRMGTSYDPDYQDETLFLKMQGRVLYEYALKNVPGVVKKSLDRAGLGLEDVDQVLLHQANAKMDEAILKRLFRLYDVAPIPEKIMPMTIATLGNSSVATLPTLLNMLLKGELEGHSLNTGDIVVFASVGAGMNINSLVYRWP